MLPSLFLYIPLYISPLPVSFYFMVFFSPPLYSPSPLSKLSSQSSIPPPSHLSSSSPSATVPFSLSKPVVQPPYPACRVSIVLFFKLLSTLTVIFISNQSPPTLMSFLLSPFHPSLLTFLFFSYLSPAHTTPHCALHHCPSPISLHPPAFSLV